MQDITVEIAPTAASVDLPRGILLSTGRPSVTWLTRHELGLQV